MITKNRWGMDSRYIGIIVEPIGWAEDDKWLVLWSISKSYKLQEHLGSNLIELSKMEGNVI